MRPVPVVSSVRASAASVKRFDAPVKAIPPGSVGSTVVGRTVGVSVEVAVEVGVTVVGLTVGLTLRDGSRVDGILRDENDTHVTLLVGTPAVEQQVAKADITERSNPISAMPPLGLLLEPREVRYLVEFLAALK